MKKFTKSVAVALALALTLSLGAGVDADAATKAKKATVSKVTAVDKATGKASIKLAVGKKATVNYTVTGKNLTAKTKKVTFKTSNKRVATVSAKGVIAGKKAGKATITVTSKTNKKKSAKIKVQVVKKSAAKITKVTLNKTKTTIEVGAKETLKATVKAKKAADKKKVVWTTSNKAVATVSKTGVVTAKKVGTAVITIATTDGSAISKTCKVTVKAKAVDVKKTTVLAPKDGNVTVSVDFTNAEAVQKDVDALAKVAVKAGDDIQVTLNDKVYTATFDGTNVKINGKLFAQSEAAKNAKTVKVTVAVKADKIAAVTAFAPASVTKVTVGNVVFTKITATTFEMNGKTYTYKVNGKNIEVEGDVSADFAGLSQYVNVTVK